jgi:hypothetical protein
LWTLRRVEGAVSIEYSTRTADGYYQGYSPDDHDDRFSLCPKCSKSFLAFIKHDGNRGDGQRGSELPNSDDAKDAARWRWWCRWWLDEKDDMETINGLVYEGDSKPSLDAASCCGGADEPGQTM